METKNYHLIDNHDGTYKMEICDGVEIFSFYDARNDLDDEETPITELYLPASVQKIEAYNFYSIKGLKRISVHPKNAYFTAEDGVPTVW